MTEIDQRARMERDTYPARLRLLGEESGQVIVRYSGFDEFRMKRAEWDALPIWKNGAFTPEEIEGSDQ